MWVAGGVNVECICGVGEVHMQDIKTTSDVQDCGEVDPIDVRTYICRSYAMPHSLDTQRKPPPKGEI
ncbi:hypothetical protein Dimus_019979 [Dionaea muscipula]